MARPRTISDERLLTATGTVIARLGPGFTVADVAREAGVATGTVMQRFGSKHGLLVALSRSAIEWITTTIRTAAARQRSPLAALRAGALAGWDLLEDSAANHLAQLGTDLADPELRALLGEHHAAMEVELTALVAAAAAELPGAPLPARAARILAALVQGTALRWSVRPEGRLTERLRRDLNAVLAGWAQPATPTTLEES